jgi:hypothetical protein
MLVDPHESEDQLNWWPLDGCLLSPDNCRPFDRIVEQCTCMFSRIRTVQWLKIVPIVVGPYPNRLMGPRDLHCRRKNFKVKREFCRIKWKWATLGYHNVLS